MATPRYRRVPLSEPDDQETNKKLRAERIEKITSKIHAFVWVVISLAILYFTDGIRLLQDPNRTNRIALNVAVVAFTVVVGIFFYLAVWLQYMKKVTVPWDIYCPNMIPTATGASVVCFISLIVTFWPSWGFLSPLFVGALTIGGIFSTAFIPWPC